MSAILDFVFSPICWLNHHTSVRGIHTNPHGQHPQFSKLSIFSPPGRDLSPPPGTQSVYERFQMTLFCLERPSIRSSTFEKVFKEHAHSFLSPKTITRMVVELVQNLRYVCDLNLVFEALTCRHPEQGIQVFAE